MSNGQADSQTEQAQFKRALLFLGSAFALLIILFLITFCSDASPPRDEHLLVEGIACDQTNPLAAFRKKVISQPYVGTNPLEAVDSGSRPETAELKHYLELNQFHAANWDDLIKTDIGSWQWPIDHSTRLLDFGLSLRPLYDTLRNTILVEFQVLIDEQQSQSAIDLAMEVIKFGRGIQNTRCAVFPADTGYQFQSVGLRKLKEAIIFKEHGIDQIQRIHALLPALEYDLSSYTRSIRINYTSIKYTLDHSNQIELRELFKNFNLGQRTQNHILLRKNKTLRLIANSSLLLIDATLKGPADLLAASDEISQKIESVKHDDWRLKYNSNVTGINIARSTLMDFTSRADSIVRGIGTHRITITMLALRLFELSHQRLPEKLDELVPIFLDSIPLDPFDGKPLRWDKNRSTVYCVGLNQTDDGGQIDKMWTSRYGYLDHGQLYWWSAEAKQKQEAHQAKNNKTVIKQNSTKIRRRTPLNSIK